MGGTNFQRRWAPKKKLVRKDERKNCEEVAGAILSDILSCLYVKFLLKMRLFLHPFLLLCQIKLYTQKDTTVHKYRNKVLKTGREGTLGCLLQKSPKSYNIVFLFVGLTTLGAFIEFLMVGSLSQVSKRFNHYL